MKKINYGFFYLVNYLFNFFIDVVIFLRTNEATLSLHLYVSVFFKVNRLRILKFF